MTQKLKPLFSTLISEGTLPHSPSLNRRLLKVIDSMRSEDRMGQKWSQENYVGGYTSYASLSDLHRRDPIFMELEELLQPHAETFAKAQGWILRDQRLTMTACWMNWMPRHAYHSLHHHPHSAVSGTYYVDTPTGSAALRLEDPRMGFYMSAPVREARGRGLYYSVVPKAGSFVLFESWVRHEVPPNRSDRPRVSISFNYSME